MVCVCVCGEGVVCVCGEGVVDGVVKGGGGGGRIKKDRLRISFYQTAHNLGSH